MSVQYAPVLFLGGPWDKTLGQVRLRGGWPQALRVHDDPWDALYIARVPRENGDPWVMVWDG